MLSMLAISCHEGPRPGPWSEVDVVSDLAPPGYLALVSVTLTDSSEQDPTALEAPDARVSSVGTFLEYAGGSEQHVRALSGISRRAMQRFSPGTCVRGDALSLASSPSDSTAAPAEVMLLDVGNISLEANEQRLPFDLVLVPDLPPVFAGVSYRQRDASLQLGTPSPDGTFSALLHIDALSDSDLNEISEQLVFPPAIGLRAELDEERTTLHARWNDNAEGALEFELDFVNSTGDGLQVVCVVEDNSALTLTLRDLEGLKLPSTPPVKVTARRVTNSARSSGVFEEIEFQAIRTSQVLLEPSLP